MIRIEIELDVTSSEHDPLSMMSWAISTLSGGLPPNAIVRRVSIEEDD